MIRLETLTLGDVLAALYHAYNTAWQKQADNASTSHVYGPVSLSFEIIVHAEHWQANARAAKAKLSDLVFVRVSMWRRLFAWLLRRKIQAAQLSILVEQNATKITLDGQAITLVLSNA